MFMVIALAVFSIICLTIGVISSIREIRESTVKSTIVENSILCTMWIILIIFDILLIIDKLFL